MSGYCPTSFELGEKDVTNEYMDCDLVEECEMGSGSEELIGSWCSCADSSDEVEGEGDRQEDMLRNVKVICVVMIGLVCVS